MARIHARKRGSSRSRKPVREGLPDWVSLDADEVVEEVVALARQGRTQAEIGLELRDRLGVPDVKEVTGKKVGTILAEHDLEPDVPEDLRALMERAVQLDKHLQQHPKDTHNRRGLTLIESKIRRIVKYYVREGRLPEGWTYSMAQAKLLTE